MTRTSDGATVVAIGAPGAFGGSSVAGSLQITTIASGGGALTSVTILPTNSAVGDQFGTMVATFGDGTAIFVGASTATASSVAGAGTVTVIRFASNTWSVTQTLTGGYSGTGAAATPTAIGFGYGLAVSAPASGRLVVGGGYSATLPGQAFTFVQNQSAFVFESTFVGPAASAVNGDAFSYCVGIAADSSSISSSTTGSGAMGGTVEIYAVRTSGSGATAVTASVLVAALGAAVVALLM